MISIAESPHALFRPVRVSTLEAAGVIGVTRALVMRDLRIWAQWPCHNDVSLCPRPFIFRGNDFARCFAVFHPLFERVQHIVIRIVRLEA